MADSLVAFEPAMSVIVPHPAFSERERGQRWRAWRGTAALLTGAYRQYPARLFRPLMWRGPVTDPAPLATEAQR